MEIVSCGLSSCAITTASPKPLGVLIDERIHQSYLRPFSRTSGYGSTVPDLISYMLQRSLERSLSALRRGGVSRDKTSTSSKRSLRFPVWRFSGIQLTLPMHSG